MRPDTLTELHTTLTRGTEAAQRLIEERDTMKSSLREGVAGALLRIVGTGSAEPITPEDNADALALADELLTEIHAQMAASPNRPTMAVMRDVIAERRAQDQRWGEQNHPDGTGSEVGHATALAAAYRELNEDSARCTWHAILLEEVYEAVAESDPVKLRTELVQVAAVAAAWVEAIDRREGQS